MNRILTVGVLSAALAACVGPVDTGSSSSQANSQTNSSAQSSATVVSSSSVTVSSSSVAVSSSSVVVSSSSSAPQVTGDLARGRELMKAFRCAACHQDEDNDGFFVGVGQIDVDSFKYPTSGDYDGNYSDSSIAELARFIQFEMPANLGVPAADALDIATYLWALRDGVPGERTVATACTANDPNAIHYGRRTLHVMTSYEYHNSLSKLFGLPLPADYSSPAKVSVDTEIARLPNHTNEKLGETRLNQYYDNATEIADWAMSTPGALTFACDDPVACAADFMNEFAYVAYRRALNDAEKAEFTRMFEEASSLETGLRWALTTVLMSPNFLYRSELGTKVSDLLANPVVAPGTDYDYEGTPVSVTNLDGEIPHYSSVSIPTGTHNWTGNDLISFSVKATQRGDGSWPKLNVGEGYDPNGGTTLQTLTINHSGFRTYYLMVDEAYTRPIYFHNDVNGSGGHNNSGNGSIELANVKVGKLGTSEPVQDDVESLNAADPNAYALDPYEYASALSFALTGSGPSKSLLDAAVAGELVDDASFEAHVDALIDSPLGQAHVERLAGMWFRTDGLPGETRNVPEYTTQVRDSMMQEIREIYKHVFYNGDFPSMYEGDFTFLDSTLAEFYGMAGNGGSSHGDFRYVDTTGTLRGGIIASGGFMTYNAHMDYTSPIQRSARFRQDVLCQAIPLPVNLEDSDERDAATKRAADRADAGDITTAEYFDIQTNVPGSSCAGCHNAIINPLFGMDDFDNVGRLRKRVNGDVVQVGLLSEAVDEMTKIVVPKGDADLPIDFVNNDGYLFSPNVVGTLSAAQADADKLALNGIKFKGAKDLGKKIVENELPGISACLIEKTTRYTMGYTLNKQLLEDSEKQGASYLNISDEQEAEFVCVQDELEAAYAAAKSPRDVLKALVKSSAFRFRK